MLGSIIKRLDQRRCLLWKCWEIVFCQSIAGCRYMIRLIGTQTLQIIYNFRGKILMTVAIFFLLSIFPRSVLGRILYRWILKDSQLKVFSYYFVNFLYSVPEYHVFSYRHSPLYSVLTSNVICECSSVYREDPSTESCDTPICIP